MKFNITAQFAQIDIAGNTCSKKCIAMRKADKHNHVELNTNNTPHKRQPKST